MKIKIIESSYSHIMQMLSGLIPSVKTIGIITAENPMGVTSPNEENLKRNEKLGKQISENLMGYKQVKGKYGNLENPYFIMNISNTQLKKFAKDYQQKAYIFGKKSEEKEYSGYIFYYMELDDNEEYVPISERKVFINRQNATDFYTEIKGRKFQIPFFDVKEEESSITTLDKYSNAYFQKGKIIGHEREVQIKLEMEKRTNNLILEGMTSGFYWRNRGVIGTIVNFINGTSTEDYFKTITKKIKD